MKQCRMVALLMILIVAFATAGFAEETSQQKEAQVSDKQHSMPEIVVTGQTIIEDKSKLSFRTETLPADVQVITKEDIERLNVATPVELLRKIPGMHLENYGQGDIGSAITMRGMAGGASGGRYVAVYVDGVPQNLTSYFGDNVLAWLTPEMIERIEVIKGPFSALYGNTAIGGVINIITKNSDKSSSISAAGGSYGTARISPVITTDTFKLTPFVTGEYYRTDGYRDHSQAERGNVFSKLTMPLLGQNLSVDSVITMQTGMLRGICLLLM